MKHLMLCTFVIVFGLVSLDATAGKRIRYNIHEKVLKGEKSVEGDAINNRGPASTKEKKGSNVPELLRSTNTPRYLTGKNSRVDCQIRNVGTSYRGEQCASAFLEF